MFSPRLSLLGFGAGYRSTLPRSPLATRFQIHLPRLPPSPLLSPSASLASFKSALPARPSPCRSFSSSPSTSTSFANMGSLAPYQRKHKITVVGSGNWYASCFLCFCFCSCSCFVPVPGLMHSLRHGYFSPMLCYSSLGSVEIVETVEIMKSLKSLRLTLGSHPQGLRHRQNRRRECR